MRSDGKRRVATSLTMAGVIIPATTSSDSTTITGVEMNTTTSGAIAACRPGRPIASSQCPSVDISAHDEIVVLTASMAGSQKK